MSRDIMSAVPELSSWDKNLEDFAANYKALLQRVRDLDAKNRDLEADLQDQTQSRRTWMKRAQENESRVAHTQYVLLLIDGNQSCFNDTSIRAGINGANAAAETLLDEIRAIARSQHKDGLADKFAVVVQIFVDTDRLGDDLVAAGSLSDRAQLHAFFKALSASHAMVSVVDCGPGREAVDAKIQDSYELNIENLHCRHIILGMGHDSEYYATLDSYSQDELTKSKTSLLKSMHGFPSRYDLPYHLVEFSVLVTVPLIVLEDRLEHPAASTSDENTDLTTLARALPLPGSEPSSTTRTIVSRSTYKLDPAVGGSSPASESQPVISRDGTEAPKSHASSGSSLVARKATSSDRSASSKAPVSSASSHLPQAPAPQGATTSGDSWEHQYDESAYMTPAYSTPWGAEPTDNASVEPAAAEGDSATEPWGTLRNGFHGQPPVGPAFTPKGRSARDTGHSSPVWDQGWKQRSREAPRSFEGTWDEVIARDEHAFAPPPLPEFITNDARIGKAPFRMTVARNRRGQRVDQPLPAAQQQDLELLRNRGRHQHLCNEHQLRGKCLDQSCKYSHEPLDDGVLLALRHIARTQPCDIGPSCRRNECYSGHHCPYMESGGCCKKNKTCLFYRKGMHDMHDLKVANVIPV